MTNLPPPSRSQEAAIQSARMEARKRRETEAAAMVYQLPAMPRWVDYHPSTIARGFVRHHGGRFGFAMVIQELGALFGWSFAMLGWLGHLVAHRRSIAAAEEHLRRGD